MKKSEVRPYLEMGKRIAELRKAVGWNQDDLAEKSGVGISSLKDIERGVSEGYLDTRQSLADALNCSIADFYKGVGASGIKAPEVLDAADLLAKFAALPPNLKLIALTVIHQDKTYLRQIPVAVQKELVQAIGAIFQSQPKANQK